MAIVRSLRRHPRVEIINMVDVMFFLLAFFMLFSTFRTTPAGLDVQLPRAATAQREPAAELLVTVDARGRLYLDGREVSAGRLQELAAQAVRQRPDVMAIVRADRQVAYEYVVQAIDALRLAGVYRLALAVQLSQLPQPSRL
ncbi:MAG TPA: biopolymer transporter ExbD [Limnochordales bacterium]